MSNSLPISDEIKNKLSRLKRENETWDDFLSRLANEKESINIGSWSDKEADRVREAVKRSKKSFEE